MISAAAKPTHLVQGAATPTVYIYSCVDIIIPLSGWANHSV